MNNIKANYETMGDIAVFVADTESDLEGILKDISKSVLEIKKAWKGYDCDIFVEKLNSFIAIEEIQNERIRVLGEIIKNSSSVYSDKDLEWQQEIKKEGDAYGTYN